MIPVADILKYAMKALEIVPGLITAGHDAIAFVTKSTNALNKMQKEKRGPTKEEKQELDATIEMLRKKLHDPDPD